MQLFMFNQKQPDGKDVEMYLPFPHSDSRFSRVATNFRENRQCSNQYRIDRQSLAAVDAGSYRTFGPKYLVYLKRGKGGVIEGEKRPVKRVGNPWTMSWDV